MLLWLLAHYIFCSIFVRSAMCGQVCSKEVGIGHASTNPLRCFETVLSGQQRSIAAVIKCLWRNHLFFNTRVWYLPMFVYVCFMTCADDKSCIHSFYIRVRFDHVYLIYLISFRKACRHRTQHMFLNNPATRSLIFLSSWFLAHRISHFDTGCHCLLQSHPGPTNHLHDKLRASIFPVTVLPA